MARRGNVARLPLPPSVSGSFAKAGEDVKILQAHLVEMTTILNQSLQSLQNRQNTVQQTGATTPPTVTGLAVTGKQGCIYLVWKRINNVDGYVVMQATDSAMSSLVGRYNVPDGDQASFVLPIGNNASTFYFQVYAYQGPKYSDPSAIVSGTSLTYTSSEAAPPTPPIAPRHPKIAPVRSGPNL